MDDDVQGTLLLQRLAEVQLKREGGKRVKCYCANRDLLHSGIHSHLEMDDYLSNHPFFISQGCVLAAMPFGVLIQLQLLIQNWWFYLSNMYLVYDF